MAALVAPARAEDRGSLIIPEARAFVSLSEQARAYLFTNIVKDNRRELPDGELGVHLDYTLMPILRPQLHDANWARQRYLWLRAGVVRGSVDGLRGPVFGGGSDAKTKTTTETSLLLEANSRWELADKLWLVPRARFDLRDLDGDTYRRYRLRVGIEREFVVDGTTMVPYIQVETFYDTRYSAWSRQLLETGVEFELSKAWRFETFVSLQNDKHSASATFNALNFVLKWYH